MGILALLFGAKASASTSDVEVIALSESTVNELVNQTATGSSLLAKYVGAKSEYTPDQIDDAIVSWTQSTAKDKEDANRIIEVFGAYFGDYLNRKLGLEWKEYRDKKGSDLCVIHKKLSVFSFPHSAIYKAVVDGRKHALANVEAALTKQINDSLSDPSVMPR